MPIFTAHFDESGKELGSPSVVVAGFISDVNTLLNFDAVWKDALQDEGIKCFHMKDFVHSDGEFASWKGQDARRESFIKRLVTALRVAARHSVSVAVSTKDYWECDKTFMLHEENNPYPLCGRVAIWKTLRWANGMPIDEVEFIFDKGPEHAGELLDTMKRLGEPMPAFRDRCKSPGLQAADLIAWEHQKAYNNSTLWGKDSRPFRKSLKQLSRIPNGWNNYSPPLLEEMCRKMGIKERPK